MLTNKEIEQVRRELATLGIRDTDFPYASNMTGEELIAIIQDGINKKVGIKDFFMKYLPADFVERLVEGKSAYEIAREEGFTGTKAEWLASLHGADGRNGTNGTNGINGTNGRDGSSAGFGIPTASVDTTASGQVGVSVSASGPNTAKIFNFVFHNLGSGGGDTPGGDGRSVIGVESWFKVTANANLAAPDMSIADPSSVAGGRWSKTAGEPTADYPYLRCFLQTNYDSNTDAGYPYTRSSAYTIRYYHSDSSSDYSELIEELANLRSDLEESLADCETDIEKLNRELNELRNTIEGSIKDQLNSFRDKFEQITQTDVQEIIDNPNGLWGVLTSWVSASGNKKAFAQILADAANAAATIRAGYQFFGGETDVQLTLSALEGYMDAFVTKTYLESVLASEITLTATALRSVISKAHSGWKKADTGTLYRYDLYWDDFFADYIEDESDSDSSGTSIYADYEEYMQKDPDHGGPEPGEDDDRPEGPFEFVVIVDQFSRIQQTVDSISASVNTYQYMWFRDGQYHIYDYFKTNGYGDYPSWNNRGSAHTSYSYEDYVRTVLMWEKREVGNILSDITVSSDSIKASVAMMGYFWKRSRIGGGYNYERYAVPVDKTNDEYYTYMVNQGWTLYNFADDMAVIDVFPDQITSLVKNSTLVWINDDATGDARVRDYDYWLVDYNRQVRDVSYEAWVPTTESGTGYELTVVTDSFSRINQTADTINLAVEGQEGRIGALEVKSNKVWAAIHDGNDVSAAIELLAGLGVNNGKIILTSSAVDFVSTNANNDSCIRIENGFIDFYDGSGKLRLRIGQGTNDLTPVLKFFGADGQTELYDLGPNGLTQLDATYAVAKFVTWRFWHFSTVPLAGDRLVSMPRGDAPHDYGTSGVIYPDASRYWFQYSDAMRVVWLTQSQSAVQYMDPSTGDYSSSNTRYHNNFFLDENFSYNAPDGYYVADYNLWTIGSATYTANARVLKIVTENGVKKYYYGTMVLSFTADDITYGGYSGVIQSIDVSNLFE